MKRILLYGDSNLWGNDAVNLDPAAGIFPRFPRAKRIAGVMESLMPGCEIVEEALCARTTCLSEPAMPFRNGLEYFPVCLHSHEPLDLVVIMLGTNDMQKCYSFSAYYSSIAMTRYIQMIRSEAMPLDPPEILIVSPVELGENVTKKGLGVCFDEDSIRKVKELPAAYKSVADTYGCHFMDAAKYASPGETDDVHLTEEGAYKLGIALAEKAKEILGL